MTSQLILANGHGIAIASDSAVTMGRKRTFETSEKIYPLPLPHRLAVLHSGNVMFHGLPFGTIINEWIHSLGDVRLRAVHLYAENFNSWLLDNYRKWAPDSLLVSDLLKAFWFDFERIWRRMKKLENPMDQESIAEIWRAEIDSAEKFDDVTPNGKRIAETEFERLWHREKEDDIQTYFENMFNDFAQSKVIFELGQRYVRTSLERRYPASIFNHSCLIFVGYGTNELLPATTDLHTYGAITDMLYTNLGASGCAEHEESGVWLIKPSGQYDAIDLFFRGYAPGFIEATKSAVSRALESVNVKESEETDSAQESPMNSIGSLIENSFLDYSESKKLAGLRRTVAGMPLASLVRTSKHLIGIQRLSLEIAGELQTVGGPIDIGTITLRDGFTWVRQKDFADFVD